MDVYIFYRRKSPAVIKQLAFELGQRGLNVMLPADGLGLDLNLGKIIFDSIEKADVMLFIFEPHILDSAWIVKELEFARSLNKTILAIASSLDKRDKILLEKNPFLKSEIFSSLSDHNISNELYLQHIPTNYFPEIFDTNTEISEKILINLYDFLMSHASESQYHKDILTKATLWESRQRNPDLLLRGSDLHTAWIWLRDTLDTDYPPTQLEISFINASKRRSVKPPFWGWLNRIGLFRDDKIFISYRRADAGDIVPTIYDTLVSKFGKRTVFFDLDTIPQGADFAEFIADTLNKCSVFLAIISDKWLDIRDEDTKNRRLDNKNDWVRLEVQTALRNPYITVIPVLIDSTKMPTKHDLPDPLKDLSYKNAVRIYNDHQFALSVKKLCDAIETARNGTYN